MKQVMSHNVKFQKMDARSRSRVAEVALSDADASISNNALALDIRDKEEHDADYIASSSNNRRGKLEMNIEDKIPNLDTTVWRYCNAYNRDALSAINPHLLPK